MSDKPADPPKAVIGASLAGHEPETRQEKLEKIFPSQKAKPQTKEN